MESSEEAERKEVEKKEEETEGKMKHRRSLWWTKRKEQFTSLLVSEKGRKEEQESKGEAMALSSLDFDAELYLCRCCIWEAGAKRESVSARTHHRVGCGQRHFRGPGWQKNSGGADGKAPEKVEAVNRSESD